MKKYIIVILAFGLSGFVALRFLAVGLLGIQTQSLEVLTLEYASILAIAGLILGLIAKGKMGFFVVVPLLPLLGVSLLFISGALEKNEVGHLGQAVYPLLIGCVFVISMFTGDVVSRRF